MKLMFRLPNCTNTGMILFTCVNNIESVLKSLRSRISSAALHFRKSGVRRTFNMIIKKIKIRPIMIDKIYHTNAAVPKHYHVANSGYISDEMSGTLNSFDHVFFTHNERKEGGEKSLQHLMAQFIHAQSIVMNVRKIQKKIYRGHFRARWWGKWK